MLKFVNVSSCLIVAAFFGSVGYGLVDQDIIKDALREWFYAPSGVYGLSALLNLRK